MVTIMYSEVIELIKKEYDTDETAELIEIETSRKVLAKMMSIGQKEFYQAMEHGLQPEIKFEISDYLDYQNEKELIHGNTRYQVLRTYRKGLRSLEITCYGGVNIGNA